VVPKSRQLFGNYRNTRKLGHGDEAVAYGFEVTYFGRSAGGAFSSS
jgi:hypothetical protein